MNVALIEKASSLVWLWLAMVVLGIDRYSKVLAENYLSYAEPNPIIPGFFDLTLLYNKGAAFSFLADAGGWQRWLFSALAAVMSIVLVVWIKRTPRKIWWLMPVSR